jgi:hypothetical protein
MKQLIALVVCAYLLTAAAASAQSPAPIDTSKIGPAVGSVAPPFSGVDQRGVTRTLTSVAGPRGTMLVFFRSADW